MKYIHVPIPITCTNARVTEARNLLFKADVPSNITGMWPNQKLHIQIDEGEQGEDISYIFALGMLVGQFIH
jgi:hypothetical protein